MVRDDAPETSEGVGAMTHIAVRCTWNPTPLEAPAV